MKTLPLIKRVSQLLLLGFGLVNIARYGITGAAFVSSRFLLWGTIGSALLFLGANTAYFIQAKQYNELKRFYVELILILIFLFLFAYLTR